MTTYSSSGFSFPASNFKESDKLLLHFMPAARTLLIILSHPYGLAEESSLAKK